VSRIGWIEPVDLEQSIGCGGCDEKVRWTGRSAPLGVDVWLCSNLRHGADDEPSVRLRCSSSSRMVWRSFLARGGAPPLPPRRRRSRFSKQSTAKFRSGASEAYWPLRTSARIA